MDEATKVKSTSEYEEIFGHAFEGVVVRKTPADVLTLQLTQGNNPYMRFGKGQQRDKLLVHHRWVQACS